MRIVNTSVSFQDVNVKMKTRFHQKLDREEKENERAIDPILEELKLR